MREVSGQRRLAGRDAAGDGRSWRRTRAYRPPPSTSGKQPQQDETVAAQEPRAAQPTMPAERAMAMASGQAELPPGAATAAPRRSTSSVPATAPSMRKGAVTRTAPSARLSTSSSGL